jgi:tetratricopeptide (TPR) repeat protein
MMRKIPLVIVLFALCLLSACARQSTGPRDTPWIRSVAAVEPVSVSEFMRLSSEEKALRRSTADKGLRTLRLWNHKRYEGAFLDFEMDSSPRNLLRITRYKRDGIEFDETVRTCRRAAEIDPTHTRVWYELGRIGTDTGDWPQAMIDLETAWDALPRDQRAKASPMLEQLIVVAGAWLCCDIGLWDEGLAWLDRYHGTWGVDQKQEQMLVQGLLQAGAGLFTEAYLTSLHLPPLRVRHASMVSSGMGSKRQAGYGTRWIQAMNWHHQGEHKLALHALGTPASAKVHIPHMSRYWTDVGMLFEKDDRIAEARFDYALTLLGRAPMLYYLPIEAYSVPPVMFDEPDVTIPFMTIHQDRFVAGALFAFACQVMADCSAAEDDSVRMRRGARALDAFTICMRRGDRPELSRALRGRTRFYMGQGDSALMDLRAGYAALKTRGRIDAVTGTVIGTILMQTNDPSGALTFLAEATEADPGLAVAWRTYGVTLARVNRHDEADAAMNTAIDLNPYAISGWYNRGLHHVNLKRFAEARQDLLIATRIAPDNPQIHQLLATLERRWEEATDEAQLAVANARADSVQTALASGDALSAGQGDDLAYLGGRRVLDLSDIDFAARADSLTAAYDRSPSPETREALATALLRAGRAEQTIDLLAPLWPRDLSAVERLLVLQADRDLGRSARAVRMAVDPDLDDARDETMEFWTLIALICIDTGDRDNGLLALDRAIVHAPANSALTSFRRMITADE